HPIPRIQDMLDSLSGSSWFSVLRKAYHQGFLDAESRPVKLSPHKCELFQRKVRFLGRIVSEDGYSIDPAEMAPVQALKLRTPAT
ncbi:hypothetical protein M9458_003462, partial [Cirrhinus mrigala]